MPEHRDASVRTRRGATVILLVGGLALLGAACGSSSSVARSPAASLAPTTSATTAPPTTTASPTTAAAAGAQHVTVTPSTGLAATQTVLVEATGFTPGEPLVVIQCAAKGTSTGSADCNLTGAQSATADTTGAVRTQLTVVKGPFGTGNVVCSATEPCLVSVTQASPSPTEEADAPISFR